MIRGSGAGDLSWLGLRSQQEDRKQAGGGTNVYTSIEGVESIRVVRVLIPRYGLHVLIVDGDAEKIKLGHDTIADNLPKPGALHRTDGSVKWDSDARAP